MPNVTNIRNQKYLCQPPPKNAKFQKFGTKICQLATLAYNTCLPYSCTSFVCMTT